MQETLARLNISFDPFVNWIVKHGLVKRAPLDFSPHIPIARARSISATLSGQLRVYAAACPLTEVKSNTHQEQLHITDCSPAADMRYCSFGPILGQNCSVVFFFPLFEGF